VLRSFAVQAEEVSTSKCTFPEGTKGRQPSPPGPCDCPGVSDSVDRVPDVVVRYHPSQVDAFIALADAAEDALPGVFVDGFEDEDAGDEGLFSVALGGEGGKAVAKGVPSDVDELVQDVGKALAASGWKPAQ